VARHAKQPAGNRHEQVVVAATFLPEAEQDTDEKFNSLEKENGSETLFRNTVPRGTFEGR